jgi:tripartite ATP-independent transporter DctM subunit
MIWVMLGLFFGLLFMGVPVAFSMAIASLFGVLVFDIPVMMLMQKLHSGIDLFPYLAIPFFILAGSLMETGGISLRLVNLAKSMVGHIRGGLGMVVVVSEVLFSGISGSSIADASAIGSTMLPAMKRAGYSAEHSVSIITAASGMGILIPPCLVMIVLASIADQSVAALFFAGFLPGFLMALTLIGVIYIQARKGILPGGEEPFQIKRLTVGLGHSIIPMIMPVIIFGGILGGIATATEVAVLAVLYALVVAIILYKEIKFADLPQIFTNSILITGSVMLLLGVSASFTWILATQQVPQMVSKLILSMTTNPYLFLIVTNLVFILAAALLDGLPALLIFFPIFYPTAKQLGIHPLQFSLLAVASNGIGMILPPIGLLLIVVCGIAKTSLSAVFRPMIPYIAILVFTLFVVMFIPWIILVIPRLFFQGI